MAFRYRPYHVIWMWLVILVSGYVTALTSIYPSPTTSPWFSESEVFKSSTAETSNSVLSQTSRPMASSSIIDPSPSKTPVTSITITPTPSGSNTVALSSPTTAAVHLSPSQTQILSTILPTSSASVNQTVTSASVNQTVTPSPTTCWACKSRACRNIQGPCCLVTFLLGISLLIIVHAIF